jgi:hypothetical protein
VADLLRDSVQNRLRASFTSVDRTTTTGPERLHLTRTGASRPCRPALRWQEPAEFAGGGGVRNPVC